MLFREIMGSILMNVFLKVINAHTDSICKTQTLYLICFKYICCWLQIKPNYVFLLAKLASHKVNDYNNF